MATIEEQGTLGSHPEEGRSKYKSFKKKFRKMKRAFDIAMQQSNVLFLEEHEATKTAKRLAQENDQILDLLLDVNNSAQMPVDKRIDVTLEAPGLSAIPSLVSEDDLTSLGTLHTQEGEALLAEVRSMLAKRAASSKASQVPKSLAQLMSTTPHLTSDNPSLPREVLTSLEPSPPETIPYAYLSPDQLDDYIYDIDASLGTAPPIPLQFNQPQSQPDLAFGNYHSPYNWLRRNQPQIFLQDGEGSEKSHGKPGALRGAGKRASIPAPTRPDALEIVEEDGLGYEFATGPNSKQGKRKRDDGDDGGYHPKSGTKDENGKSAKKQRVSKKKKGEDSAEKEKEKEKAPAKRARKHKAPTPDPDAHPFGPL